MTMQALMLYTLAVSLTSGLATLAWCCWLGRSGR